jgi:hypothetical protein
MEKTVPCDGKLGFRIHAAVFILTMALLVAINILTGSPYWAAWVLLSWGIGLFAHWWFGVGHGAREAA